MYHNGSPREGTFTTFGGEVCSPRPRCPCGEALGNRNTSGLCKPCRARARRIRDQQARPCLGCGTAIGLTGKTGRCRACAAVYSATPALIAAMASARWARPGAREAQSERLKSVLANLSDAERERRRVCGRKVYRDVLSRPDVMARTLSPEVRAKAGRGVSAARSAWCPTEYRALNSELRERGHSLADRKAMIADQIAADQRRAVEAERARITAMTPFERQMEAVRNGARLVDKVAMPTRELTFTVGGVSGGML